MIEGNVIRFVRMHGDVLGIVYEINLVMRRWRVVDSCDGPIDISGSLDDPGVRFETPLFYDTEWPS